MLQNRYLNTLLSDFLLGMWSSSGFGEGGGGGGGCNLAKLSYSFLFEQDGGICGTMVVRWTAGQQVEQSILH